MERDCTWLLACYWIGLHTKFEQANHWLTCGLIADARLFFPSWIWRLSSCSTHYASYKNIVFCPLLKLCRRKLHWGWPIILLSIFFHLNYYSPLKWTFSTFDSFSWKNQCCTIDRFDHNSINQDPMVFWSNWKRRALKSDWNRDPVTDLRGSAMWCDLSLKPTGCLFIPLWFFLCFSMAATLHWWRQLLPGYR